MNKINDIISKVVNISENPENTVRNYIRKTNNKAIGCFPGYCPEELVYAAQMLPVGLWGGNVEISHAKKYFPAFYCAPVQQVLEYGMRGTYNDVISGVIIPLLCDTLKGAGQNWKVAVPGIVSMPLVYPHNRKHEFGIEFLMSEYKDIMEKLESISGNKITEESLNKSIGVYNGYRRAIRRFLDIAADYGGIITPSVRHSVVKAGYFVDKAEYSALLNELAEELIKKEAEKRSGKRVILTGVMLDSKGVLEALEENKLLVAADDFIHESRQFRTDVPEDGRDPLRRIAERWASMDHCSLLYDPEKKRGDMLVELAKQKKADGIIFCMTSFCDPEEYDYPILKNIFKSNGIPYLNFEINDLNSVEQARTRIQAFAEILNG